MTKIFYVTDALDSLGIKEWSLSGLPTNEEEFLTYFSKVVDVDENNHAIFSKDPKDFGINWNEIQLEIQRLQAEYDNKTYQRNRKTEYPSIQEQLDKLYHDIKAGNLESGSWITAIEAVKNKYPKT
jgi:hypothetical protein